MPSAEPPEFPVAHTLMSRHERRRRRALEWRGRLPSIALGAAITVGLLGVSAVTLGVMGRRAEAATSTVGPFHSENRPTRELSLNGRLDYYCGARDRYWWLGGDWVIGVDPAYPSAPDIRASWTIEAGTMTTFSPSGYASYVCRGE